MQPRKTGTLQAFDVDIACVRPTRQVGLDEQAPTRMARGCGLVAPAIGLAAVRMVCSPAVAWLVPPRVARGCGLVVPAVGPAAVRVVCSPAVCRLGLFHPGGHGAPVAGGGRAPSRSVGAGPGRFHVHLCISGPPPGNVHVGATLFEHPERIFRASPTDHFRASEMRLKCVFNASNVLQTFFDIFLHLSCV